MKNLKTLLLTSVMATTAIGSGAIALAKEVASPGGYDFTSRLTSGTALLDLEGQTVNVQNHLNNDIPNAVSYWHAWFWNDDMGRRTDTTYIPTIGTGENNYVYFSAYSSVGYVAVVEIQTAHFFYYIEFNAMDNTMALTYNTTGGYPYFSAPHWTAPVNATTATMNIVKNYDGTLGIQVLSPVNICPVVNINWTLPW